MLRLTTSERYDAIAVVNRRIIVYTSPSTSSTCSSAVVNPSTLSLSNLRSGSCADPAIFGRSVIPAIAIDKDLPAPGGGPSEIVRIAHVTSASPGYALGPIVMTFSAFAYGDTRPRWTYGGGDLWLYDWADHFDLLRISATTGAVLQRLVVPKIQSPLLAHHGVGIEKNLQVGVGKNLGADVAALHDHAAAHAHFALPRDHPLANQGVHGNFGSRLGDIAFADARRNIAFIQ